MSSILAKLRKVIPALGRIGIGLRTRSLHPVPTCGLHAKSSVFTVQSERQYRTVLQHLDLHHVGALRAQSAGGPALRWQFHRSDTWSR